MSKSARATSFDVARLAGVSRAAVSRVFTPGSPVSDEMSAKVRAAAEALGYRPNTLARSLNTGRTRMIGLLVAYLDNPFYAEAVERLSLELQARGHHVLLFMATPTVTDTDRVVREIMDRQVDGIILASVTMSSSLARECERHAIPVVHFNRESGEAGTTSVVTDNWAGGHLVADFLCRNGHRRIGYMAGFEGASTQQDRERGFREGLASHGMTLAARGDTAFIRERAIAETRLMFDTSDPPDAVFVCNDYMAIATLGVLRDELKLHVPHDVAVIGFDDIPMASWPEYDLTTVRQRMGRLIVSTVDEVLRRVENSELGPERVVTPGLLMLRGTTRGT
ncbi:MAG: LacI family DNA-binding transcriptional regulator [Shimia sp.]